MAAALRALFKRAPAACGALSIVNSSTFTIVACHGDKAQLCAMPGQERVLDDEASSRYSLAAVLGDALLGKFTVEVGDDVTWEACRGLRIKRKGRSLVVSGARDVAPVLGRQSFDCTAAAVKAVERIAKSAGEDGGEAFAHEVPGLEALRHLSPDFMEGLEAFKEEALADGFVALGLAGAYCRNVAADAVFLRSPCYKIKIAAGTDPGKEFLSCHHEDGRVTLFSHDDGSGRQRWQLVPVGEGIFNIHIQGGTGAGRCMLGLRFPKDQGCWSQAELTSQDDGSGRQQWRLVPVVQGVFNVLIASGPQCGLFMSCRPDGHVDVHAKDDHSGRQQFQLYL